MYSQFVDVIFPMIREGLIRRGFRVAAFNGEDKSGVELFKKREVDVLIGSSALGTGIDGLQYICNRLIVACLPWTSAGYEQLLGRVYRQGSAFYEVEVFIPQVVLRNGAASGRGTDSASPVSTTRRHLPTRRSMASCQRQSLLLLN